MQIKSELEKIITQIEESKSILNELIREDSQNKIGIDLVMEKLRNAYELLFKIQFQHTNMLPESENHPELEITEAGMSSFSSETESKEDETFEPEKKSPAMEEEPESSEPSQEEIQKLETEKQQALKTIADKYKDKKVLAEELAKAGKKDLSSHLQNKPISSIRVAIGLNDKFQFIKDLFKGDTEAYNSTIEILDTAENLEDAMKVITSNPEWKIEDETVQKLINLVIRRHQ